LFLGSGSAHGDPPELLGSEAMKDLLGSLKEQADFVLIDTPPVLGLADTTSLAPFVDATVLVAGASGVTQAAVHEALYHLRGVEARVVGTILSKYDPSRSRDYYSTYKTRPRHGFAPRGQEEAGLRAIDGMAGRAATPSRAVPYE
jgi:polysaccharide biosynthesis transport protein